MAIRHSSPGPGIPFVDDFDFWYQAMAMLSTLGSSCNWPLIPLTSLQGCMGFTSPQQDHCHELVMCEVFIQGQMCLWMTILSQLWRLPTFLVYTLIVICHELHTSGDWRPSASAPWLCWNACGVLTLGLTRPGPISIMSEVFMICYRHLLSRCLIVCMVGSSLLQMHSVPVPLWPSMPHLGSPIGCATVHSDCGVYSLRGFCLHPAIHPIQWCISDPCVVSTSATPGSHHHFDSGGGGGLMAWARWGYTFLTSSSCATVDSLWAFNSLDTCGLPQGQYECHSIAGIWLPSLCIPWLCSFFYGLV